MELVNDSESEKYKSNNSSRREICEKIFNLEIYIDCLKEAVEKFKLINEPSFFNKYDFMMDYVNYEESILKLFEEMNDVKVSSKQVKIIEAQLEVFNSVWTVYQENEWTSDMWKIYEKIRKQEKAGNLSDMLEADEEEEEKKNIEVNIF